MPPSGRTVTIKLTTEAREAVAKVAETFLITDERVVSILVNQFFETLNTVHEVAAIELPEFSEME